MVVDANGKVAVQPVTTGAAQGNDWIVSEGLKAGDRVIVEGLQKVQPGAPVKAVEWKNAAAATPPATAPAKQAKPATKSK
jgi:membrane fusion protein (multidrug efflux system)